MKSFLLFILCFKWLFSYCQEKKSCIVLDKFNKMAIAYTTIKTKNSDRIFCTNENGYFEISDYSYDSIYFSSIGYGDKCYTKADFLSFDTIFLEPRFIVLNEVEVHSSSKFKEGETYSFGLLTKKHDFSFACDSSFNSREFALQIDIPNTIDKYLIKNIHIRLRKSKEKEINVHPIRIHLYTYVDGVPGYEILKKDIIINNANQITNNKEIVVDISQQYLTMSDKHFFIGIEFIKTYNNIQYSEPQLLITESNSTYVTLKKNFMIKGKFCTNWVILAKEGLFESKPQNQVIHPFNILAWIDVAKEE